MIEIRKTDLFSDWFDDLRDIQARARIQARIERLAAGNPGDSSQLVKAFRNYESTTGLVTGYILRSAGES